jgi:hypothetical protein
MSEQSMYYSKPRYRVRVAMTTRRQIPGLYDTIAARLRNGPATAHSVARYCDLPLCLTERFLDAYERAGKLRKVVTRYALPEQPYTPARRITIPQFRWGSTRLA